MINTITIVLFISSILALAIAFASALVSSKRYSLALALTVGSIYLVLSIKVFELNG